MSDFREAIQPIIDRFQRMRQTRFAKSNNINVDQIHIHNRIPIWHLVKMFKHEYQLRSKLFKSLSDDMKHKWVEYYDRNKDLIIMTNDEHRRFHDVNVFDQKANKWRLTPTDAKIKPIKDTLPPTKMTPSPPTPKEVSHTSANPQTKQKKDISVEHTKASMTTHKESTKTKSKSSPDTRKTTDDHNAHSDVTTPKEATSPPKDDKKKVRVRKKKDTT